MILRCKQVLKFNKGGAHLKCAPLVYYLGIVVAPSVAAGFFAALMMLTGSAITDDAIRNVKNQCFEHHAPTVLGDSGCVVSPSLLIVNLAIFFWVVDVFHFVVDCASLH
jgi:hypothetical protein